MTPLKAIREKCLDCVCGIAVEVRRCVYRLPAVSVSLWAESKPSGNR